jgi:hypothetical protein
MEYFFNLDIGLNGNFLYDSEHNSLSKIAKFQSSFFVSPSENKKKIMNIVEESGTMGCADITKLENISFEGGGKIRFGDPWDMDYTSCEKVTINGEDFLKFTHESEIAYYHRVSRDSDFGECVYFLEQLESGK